MMMNNRALKCFNNSVLKLSTFKVRSRYANNKTCDATPTLGMEDLTTGL